MENFLTSDKNEQEFVNKSSHNKIWKTIKVMAFQNQAAMAKLNDQMQQLAKKENADDK